MVREGVLEDDVMKDGKYLTVELYGLVRRTQRGMEVTERNF
jgi:hypothetical protein